MARSHYEALTFDQARGRLEGIARHVAAGGTITSGCKIWKIARSTYYLWKCRIAESTP